MLKEKDFAKIVWHRHEWVIIKLVFVAKIIHDFTLDSALTECIKTGKQKD